MMRDRSPGVTTQRISVLSVLVSLVPVAHLALNPGFGLSSIISNGGASTLVRRQLARKPALLKGKQVVVWRFVERDIRFGAEGRFLLSNAEGVVFKD